MDAQVVGCDLSIRAEPLCHGSLCDRGGGAIHSHGKLCSQRRVLGSHFDEGKFTDVGIHVTLAPTASPKKRVFTFHLDAVPL